MIDYFSGTRFYINTDMESVQALTTSNGEVVVHSSRSPEREGANEDSALVVSSASATVLAVADGFGGHPSGDEASKLALESIEASVRSRDAEEEVRTSILNGFEMANETVRSLGVGAATTLAVVEIQQEWMRSYHVGDSSIVVIGQRGKIKARTVDHSPTGYAVEAGLMNDREAMKHEERHIVFNNVGSAQMRIEIGPSVHLGAHDTVLIASDGLFDNMVFGDVVEDIRVGPLALGVEKLTQTCRGRMIREVGAHPSKPDDLTIVAFRLRSTG